MKRGEKGFTLIELLLVLAITGVLIWPLAMVITTLLTNPQRSTDQNVALRQVQNAGHWLSRDVQMASSVNATDPDSFLTLNIPVDTDENNDYSIVYLLFDGGKLKRQVYDSGDNLTSETFIADYIDTDNTTFTTLDTGLYKLTIRASKGEAVVKRSYEVSQRLTIS